MTAAILAPGIFPSRIASSIDRKLEPFPDAKTAIMSGSGCNPGSKFPLKFTHNLKKSQKKRVKRRIYLPDAAFQKDKPEPAVIEPHPDSLREADGALHVAVGKTGKDGNAGAPERAGEDLVE